MLLLTLFMLSIIYWLLYSTYDEKYSQKVPLIENTTTVVPLKPFSWDIKNINNQVKISYDDNEWVLDLEDNYLFDDHHQAILEKDNCFGQPDDFKIKATGKKLYDFFQTNNVIFSNNNSSDYEIAHNYLLSQQQFYFSCYKNKIHNLYACPPGTLFKDGNCSKINVCTGQRNGKTFPDTLNNDLRYYQVCRNGKPKRKRCKPENFFYIIDSCRYPDDSLMMNICHQKDNNFLFPFSRKKYIRCFKHNNMVLDAINNKNNNNIATVETCPKGMSILPSWDKCYQEDCINYSEGFKKAMPNKKNGSFIYSPGYFVCGKDNKIDHAVHCPNEWDYEFAGNLTHLPMVFDKGKCSVPSFCKNVLPENNDVVVPTYEFTKHVKNWPYSTLYDSMIGFRCNNNINERFTVDPGKKIDNFRVVSACNNENEKIPIGNENNKYYDCKSQKIVTCDPNHFFSTGQQKCVEDAKNAHTFKNLPFFRLGGLSPWNNWMEPWDIDSRRTKKKNCFGNFENIVNYDVCSHPQCTKFPFLKQIQSMYILLQDNRHLCTYNKHGKIVRKKYITDYKLNFWSQRHYSGVEEEKKCDFGRKIQSGNFLFDSTIFATCDLNQPFVFCPSSSTKGISRLEGKNIYACVPNDNVYIGVIPANTRVRFLTREISDIIPEFNAAYTINNKNVAYFTSGESIHVTESKNGIEYWSDRESRVLYRRLVNYPVNVLIEDKKLKYSGEMAVAYLMKKDKITDREITLMNHNVEYLNF